MLVLLEDEDMTPTLTRLLVQLASSFLAIRGGCFSGIFHILIHTEFSITCILFDHVS